MQNKTTDTFNGFWLILFALCYIVSFPFVTLHYLTGDTFLVAEVILAIFLVHIAYVVFEGERDKPSMEQILRTNIDGNLLIDRAGSRPKKIKAPIRHQKIYDSRKKRRLNLNSKRSFTHE